jgi:hypothetical protein
MRRLLVVGAGASIEECKRSGQYPNDPNRYLPVIRNFCSKLFQPDSDVLLKVTASYLDKHNIPFDAKLSNLKSGDTFTGEDMKKSPIGVFLQLEVQAPEQHNIERLSEHAWHTFGTDHKFWDRFIHDGIYLYLFALFTEQFGLGVGRPMLAGRQVANRLVAGDAVLNLNYDIAFDLALKQAGKLIRYAPDFDQNSISVLKPHGSFNFYVNLESGTCYFEEPERIVGSVDISDPRGGTFSVRPGIIPPRFNKSYERHPGAENILSTGRPFAPKTVTFWGVGLTDSDIDLLSLYRETASGAKTIEFINPDTKAYQKAVDLLGKSIIHFPTFDQWLVAS